MLNILPTTPPPPEGAIAALQAVIAQMTTFGRAVYCYAALPGENESRPAILLETSELSYRADAEILAVIAEPFFPDQPFINIAPVPTGPWWDALLHAAITLR